MGSGELKGPTTTCLLPYLEGILDQKRKQNNSIKMCMGTKSSKHIRELVIFPVLLMNPAVNKHQRSVTKKVSKKTVL